MYYLRSQRYNLFRANGEPQMRNVQHEVIAAAIEAGVAPASLKIVPVPAATLSKAPKLKAKP